MEDTGAMHSAKIYRTMYRRTGSIIVKIRLWPGVPFLESMISGAQISENNTVKIVQNTVGFVNPEGSIPKKQWPGQGTRLCLLLGLCAVFFFGGGLIAAEFLKFAFHIGKFFLKVLKLVVKSLEKTFQFIFFIR